MKLIPQTPVGYEVKLAPTCECGRGRAGVDRIGAPIFPRAAVGLGARLRDERVNGRQGYLDLREAADRVGLTPRELSALERGEMTVDAHDWDELLRRLRGEETA